MIKVAALWNIPETISELEFERWYEEKHIPDAKKIPGLKKYTVNRVVSKHRNSSRYYRMAELCFDSIEAVEEALESSEWKYAFKDASNKIADHIRLFFETKEIPL
jgi:uncharacterized protein (TIGR02118 family)